MSLLSIQYVAVKQKVHAKIQIPIYTVQGSAHSEPLIPLHLCWYHPFSAENPMLPFKRLPRCLTWSVAWYAEAEKTLSVHILCP